MSKLLPENTFVSPQFPDRDKDLVRILIAESPGETEAEMGGPLLGGSGRMLNNMLGKVGVDRYGLTITNCIQCRPPRNIFPTDPEARPYISSADAHKAVTQCLKNHVYPLLESRPWKRVDLVGSKPLALLGKKESIYAWRGSPLDIPLPSGKVLKGMATLHPAMLMRDQSLLPVCINDLRKPLTVPAEHHTLFPSLPEVQAFQYTTFSYDIETPAYRTMGDRAPVEMVGLCGTDGEAICVPFRGHYIPEIKRIFRNAKEIIGQNSLVFDEPRLRRDGVEKAPGCIHWDTLLMHHLLFPTLPHDLEFIGTQVTDHGNWKADKGSMELYNCRDTAVTFDIWKVLKGLLDEEDLTSLYLNVQVPLALICNLMKDTGIRVDPTRIRDARERFLAAMKVEEKYLPSWLKTHEVPCKKRSPAPPGTLGKSGKPVKFVMVDSTEVVIPWRSTETKKVYLYGPLPSPCPEGLTSLGMDVILDPKKKTITTGKVALGKIAKKLYKARRTEEYRAVQAIGRLNKMDELVTTFAKEGMAKSGKVHANFKPAGTSTGRLASSDPNMQNIPEATRFMYVPSHPGWDLISVDFSGIENRLQAFFAGDKDRLKRLDTPGFSEHKYLAAKMSGLPMDAIEKSIDPDSDYSKAKHVVHGTDRGLGPKKAADMYDMDIRETHLLFELWKKEIAQTILWQQRMGAQAAKDGFLKNVFGRKLWLWGNSLYTEALSFPPQSTAADILFRCMIAIMYQRIGWPEEQVKKIVKVYKPLPKPANLLLSVHDELDFEAPHEIVPDVVDVIQTVMLQRWSELGGMSLPIAISTGPSWGELEKYKL